MLVSYQQQLETLAGFHKIPVLAAVVEAGIPTSTYYRSIKGDRDLRYDTARRIEAAIFSIARRTKAA